MESRLRIRFWSSRRTKPNPSELDLHSIPYQTAPSEKQPVFIAQSLGKNLAEKRRKDETFSLTAVSYDDATAGKAPVVGGRPQKGNGPVKLQTGRMMTTGEVLPTSQDTQRTWNDIRDGDFVVAGNPRRESRARSLKSPVPSERATSPNTQTNPTSAPPTFASRFGSAPLLDIPETGNFMSSQQKEGLSPTSPNPSNWSRKSTSGEGLGLRHSSSLPTSILKHPTVSLLEPHEEQNATIRALWKAEHSRLVQLYGQDNVERNIAELRRDRDEGRVTIEIHRTKDDVFSLGPLPRPSFDVNGPRKSVSRGDSVPHDESDESVNRRLSFISSTGYASSYTTHASMTDNDSFTSREDLHKVIDGMRSTYLRAIESREPSLHAVKSMKKRKKKRKSTPSVPGSRVTSMVQTMPSPPDRKELQSAPNISPTQSQRSTRVVSQVAGIHTLPAIEASPERKEPEIGLHRADSSTLGTLMGEAKRGSIRKRASKRHSRRSSIQRNSLKISPSKSISNRNTQTTASTDQTLVSEDFEALYKDIFRSSMHEFWHSPTQVFDIVSPAPTKTSFDASEVSPISN